MGEPYRIMKQCTVTEQTFQECRLLVGEVINLWIIASYISKDSSKLWKLFAHRTSDVCQEACIFSSINFIISVPLIED